MNIRLSTLALTLTAACLISSQTYASHHFESAIAQQTPALNQLDNFVFPAPQGDSTVFIMTLNSAPKAGPDGIFASDALYNIHVSDDADYKTGSTFSLAFSNDNTYSVYQAQSPNAAVGTLGEKIGGGTLYKTSDLADGIKVWAGVVKDPFFGNSSSLGLFHAQLNAGKAYDPKIWSEAKGKSIFIGRHAAAIVLQVPNSMLGKTIRVFMTTAQEQNGTWTQVQYSANPLLSHITLFENAGLKTEHDQSRPDTDNSIKPLVAARVARAAALAKSQPDPQHYGDSIADQLIPDVLTYSVGTAAKYTPSERNGRALDDDAMSTILTLVLGTPTDQAIDNPHLHTDTFPYLIADPIK